MLGNNEEHPVSESLLLFVEGELQGKEIAFVQAHLDACWDCRGKISKIEMTITDFTEFEKRIWKFQTPSANFSDDFNSKLRALSAETKAQKKKEHRFFDFLKFYQNLSFSAKFANVLAFVVIVALLVSQFVLRTQKVSAAEILANADASEKTKSGEVFQPVINQKIQIKKKINGTETESFAVESWNDKLRLRQRLALLETDGRKLITENAIGKNKDEISAPLALDKVRKILRKNRMDAVQPLSANSFANWRNAANLTNETVEKSVSETGAEILSINSETAATSEKGLIVSAKFSVRSSDWHPVKLVINVQNESLETFEFSETDYQVISYKNLDAGILPSVETVVAVPNAEPLESANQSAKNELETKPDANSNTNLTNKSETAEPKILIKPETASSEDELEILRVLQNANADLGEQISVERRADGKISVSGIVENKTRRDELTKALQAVADPQKVKINIRAVDELNRTKRAPNKSETIATEEIPETTAVPVDRELRSYFSKQGIGGTALNERIEGFSRQILGRSRRVSQFGWSLRKLAEGFSAKQVAEFTPEAKAKRNSLLLARVRDFRREAQGLRDDLQPAFGNLSGAAGIGKISSEQELREAVKRLADASRNLDEAVRGSFTLGNAPNAAAVGNASFAQTLKTAIGLAEQIENYLK